MQYTFIGVGIAQAQLVDCWTCDWKVTDLSPGRSSRRNSLSRVNLLCWLIQCPLHSCVTAVASTFILPKALVAGYTQTCIHPSPNQWADYAVEAQCGNWAHTQLIREHSSTVVSTCWATVDLPGLKSGIGVRQLTSTKSAGWEWPLNRPSKSVYAKKKSLPHSHLKDASICKIKPYYVQLFAIVIRSSFRMWAWLK